MRHIRVLAFWMLVAALLTGYLESVRLLLGVPFTPVGVIGRWGWLLAVLALAAWSRSWSAQGSLWYFPLRFWLLVGSCLAALAWYLLTLSTSSAWVVIGVFYVLVLVSAEGIEASTVNNPLPWRFLWRGMGWGGLAAVGGLFPVALQQVESRFSEEEFFAALDAVALILFTMLLLGGHLWLARCGKQTLAGREAHTPDIYLNGRLMLSVWAVILALGGWGVVYAYQHSFYPSQAPTFEGITPASPFLCSSLDSTNVEDDTSDGEMIFRRLLARVEANPRKATTEYGMLALATGERHWAEAFRETILEEAAENRFAGPANSVKFIQHEAALRIYYLQRIRDAFPDLLPEHEWALIQDWLRAINHRSLTVEWVDWMYGLAFSKWPEGPYENQENGAGLLALLETLEADELSPEAKDLSRRNRDYLARYQRGWFQRFRNTDDAYTYQPEWINNALFQAMYWGDIEQGTSIARGNQRLSFEWLLLQALPDGTAIGYNHPARPPLVMVTYLGAELLGDPRYLWLSARSLEAAEAKGRYLSAQPGIEAPVALSGSAPTEGSCLLFGDSGLPNQQGPLAPDKIVFRSGWQPDSAYLLLNLRFTGWHRYKSTNSVVWVHQDGPLAIESSIDKPSPWLPVGRSQFRDKRIPRENLNGLLIPRSGVSRVLYDLIGAGGSPWAQDPPYYARVERFETLGLLDVSRTVLDNWRGWDHTRTIYFTHSGPIVIVDTAKNRQGRGHPAISWHLIGEGHRDDDGLWLRQGTSPARLALPRDAWDMTEITPVSSANGIGLTPDWDIIYHSPETGQLSLSTAFLLGPWADANHEASALWDETDEVLLGQYVHITGSSGEIELLHNESAVNLQKGRLSTDGQSLIRLDLRGDEGEEVCYIGGQNIRIQLLWTPARVTDLTGHALPRGEVWDWAGETLFIYENAEDSRCVRVLPH
jgi:hypothetical protein